MYGRKAKDRKNPDTKPQTWAKLSIHGSRPKEKKKAEMASSLAKARHGRSSICQLWNSSTNRQARMPNWLPAGPTWCGGNRVGDRVLSFSSNATWSKRQPLAGVTTYLGSVGQEDGWGQVAGDAAEHVDDGDPEPSSKLLNVPQHGHLEQHRHQAVQDPTERGEAEWDHVSLTTDTLCNDSHRVTYNTACLFLFDFLRTADT